MTDSTVVLMVCYIDVYIDVPETLDISFMRSRGLQPGEELLPEDGMCYTIAFDCSINLKNCFVMFKNNCSHQNIWWWWWMDGHSY